MLVVKSIPDLQSKLLQIKEEGKSIGFVPTMGALHEGHVSLIQESKKKSDFTVCSIYVNESQFNQKEDFIHYPRTLESDLALLESENCDCVFVPSAEEMSSIQLPEKFEMGDINDFMEGIYRPSHFLGVAQVVYRFFVIVRPDYAFFGIKDYQQVTLIQRVNRQFQFNIDIVACAIKRNSKGLALSSRNMRLSSEQKTQALGIYNTLQYINSLNKKALTGNDVIKMGAEFLEANYPVLRLEYLSLTLDGELAPFEDLLSPSKHYRACIAAYLEDVRLIDNMEIYY